MKSPKVSVIIPLYNGEKFISETTESVLAQTYKNMEIIIINDGSTDGSHEKIKPYLNRIKYIYQENKGISVARNKAILNSTGEYIAFLDHDDLWKPEKITLQVQYLDQHQDVGFVHTNLSIMRDTKITKEIFQTEKRNREGDCFNELLLGNFINMLTVMVRRKCLEQVGIFDPDIKVIQDYDLWLRIAKHFRLGYINKPLAIYRIHDSNISKNKIRLTLEEIKLIKTMLRLYPGLREKIGIERIKQRFLTLYYEVAYSLFKMRKLAESRRYFFEVWKISPFKIDCLSYLMATIFPLSIVKFIKRIKR